MPCPQDELSSIWQKLEDGTGLDPTVAAMIVSNEATIQTMIVQAAGKLTTYTDSDPPSDGTTETCSGTYSRIRRNKEEDWGPWRSV